MTPLIIGVLVAGLGATAGPARGQVLPVLPPAAIAELDPTVASCVLANLEAARTSAAAALLIQSCRQLVLENSRPEAEAGQLFVRCKVATDPEWIEFRLVTRKQCETAAGELRQ